VIPPDQARRRLQETVTRIRERTFPYRHRPRPRFPWHEYDWALRRESENVADIIRGLVALYTERHPWTPPDRPRGGRPPVPLPDRLRVLLWQSYRSLPNRGAEADLRLLGTRLGVRRTFCYKVVEKAYSDPRVAQALGELLALTNLPVLGLEETFSPDGSGFGTSVRQHYASARARQSGKEREEGSLLPPPSEHHDWVYNVAMVGVHYKLIAGWKSWTDHTEGELSVFPEVFRQTRELHPGMRKMIADGGFSARWVVGLLHEAGVEARILPRRNVTLHSYGTSGWVAAHWGLITDPQEWLEEYHQRSAASEAEWGALKARHPGKIRKRRDERRVTEARLRGVLKNVRRLAYLRWMERDPKFRSGLAKLHAGIAG
jgi:transposase